MRNRSKKSLSFSKNTLAWVRRDAGRSGASGRRCALGWIGLLTICLTIRVLPAGAAEPVDVDELVPKTTAPLLRLEWIQEPDDRIVPLSEIEQDHLRRQREIVAEAARKQGRVISGARSDLDVLQLLVDRSVFDEEQPYELQALGVVLGDIVRKQFDYEWVAYIDSRGRTRALHRPRTGQVVFPVTAISQRIESGLEVDVEALFEALSPRERPPER